MKTRRGMTLMIVVLSISLLLSACGTPATPAPAATQAPAAPAATQAPAAPAPAATKCKIGFSVYDMQYGFFQEMERGTKEAAQAAGCDYILVDQKSSESTMVSATSDMLNQGITALIISPIKPDAMGPIVDAAKAKGLPVVVDDIGGGGTNYDVIVISDNYKGGVLAAEEMDKLIKAKGGSKNVASITCEPSAVYAARRNQGFEAKIKELGYTVVASLSGNSKQEEGYKVMKDVLSAHPDVAGVFSCNDPMAVGAAQAIADSGKSGSKDIFVIGFNADDIALQAIKAGQMAGTVQQVPYEMGKMTVALAQQLAAKETLKYDNAAEREILVPVNLIDAANVDTLLKPAPAAATGGAKTYVLVPKNLGNPYFDTANAGAQEAAKELGVTVTYQGPATADATQQIQLLNALIAQKVNGLAISADDADALVPTGKAAMDAGIPVVTWDSAIAKDGRTIHINQAESAGIADVQLKMALDLTGPDGGDIAILSATSTAPNQNEWIGLMKEALKKPEYAKLNLVDTVYGDDDDTKSYSEAQGLMKKYPNLKVIIAPTTVGIAASARAVQDAKMVGKLLVTGLGTPNQMREYVKSGAAPQFALWNPSDLGYLAIYATDAIASGKIKGQPGDKFSAGKLGDYTINPDGTVLLGAPFIYNADNIDDFNW